MAKISRENGRVIHLETYNPLNDELTGSGELFTQPYFNKIYENQSLQKMKLLDGETTVYQPYQDDNQTEFEGTSEWIDDVIPEDFDT